MSRRVRRVWVFLDEVGDEDARALESPVAGVESLRWAGEQFDLGGVDESGTFIRNEGLSMGMTSAG